jgi:hypothetical protein
LAFALSSRTSRGLIVISMLGDPFSILTENVQNPRLPHFPPRQAYASCATALRNLECRPKRTTLAGARMSAQGRQARSRLYSSTVGIRHSGRLNVQAFVFVGDTLVVIVQKIGESRPVHTAVIQIVRVVLNIQILEAGADEIVVKSFRHVPVRLRWVAR